MSEERKMPPADDRKTTTSSLTTSTSGSKKFVIKSADMNEEMQNDAVNIVISVFESCSVEKNAAELIKAIRCGHDPHDHHDPLRQRHVIAF
ncbi:putative dynein light chain superfamily protein [Helianthus annuus]|nr:putative dynein light chain superfamily protein [Helianthus annuus]